MPPLEETGTPTDFADATSFLYTGSTPPQTGVAPGTMDARRVAVAYGRVLNRVGAPLSGVKVTTLSHPEWGQTLTRGDGTYEFALNGGGTVILQFEKEGLLPVQRSVKTPWRDWVAVEDVALTALDTAVTVLTAQAATLQVARGHAVSDADGPRQATLLVPAGTGVTLTLPNGTTQPLSSMSVRATEYTVGTDGPRAMPGALPPLSGYTYAVEWSLDEALAAGATRVSFSQSVYFYLENFLGFPAGKDVPTGYYDRQAGTWQADADGRVVKVVSITSGMADVDVTGDGVADVGAPLTALGFTNEERQRLATLYSPGASLWRVPLTHLTPWDCNWPYGFPDDATAPPDEEPEGDEPEPKPCKTSGSIIECENQTLGEAVPIVGTPYTLRYQSDRVPGRTSRYSFEVPVTGASVPQSLRYAIVDIQGAGRSWHYTFNRLPNQRFTFQWDGLDRWGRKLQGVQTFRIDVGFAYRARYREPADLWRSFNAPGGAYTASSNRQTMEVFLWRNWTQKLVAHDALAQALGGWTLNVHHTFESGSGTLFRGDGERQSAKATGAVWQLVAGAGYGVTDGGVATESSFGVNQLVAGDDGSVYTRDTYQGVIRRIAPDGRVYTVVGCKSGCTVTDGGVGAPATKTDFGILTAHDVGPDGSHYVAKNNKRVYRITPDGIVHHFAGNGQLAFSDNATNGEGGPATQAATGDIDFIKASPAGEVYLGTASGGGTAARIRRVDAEGLIFTVVGNGTNSMSATPVPALSAGLGTYQRAGLDSSGALYFAGTYDYRIRKLDRDGLVRSVVGNGTSSFSGDHGPAALATIERLSPEGGIAVGPDDSLYFVDGRRVRRIGPDGVVTTVAGTGANGSRLPVPGANALQTDLYATPMNLAVAPDGALHIAFEATTYPHRVYKLVSPSSTISLGEILVPSEDGRAAYVFRQGQHLRTLDALTGATLLTFGYDSAARLVTLTDANGEVTTIERQADGRPTAIVAPGGQRTGLEVSPERLLSRVENPSHEAVTLEYGAGGLLTKLTDARNGVHPFEYDATGRLLKDSNPGGGFKTLTRSKPSSGARAGKAGFAVEVTTAEGRVILHTSERVGSLQRRTTRTPAGVTTVTDRGDNGLDVTTYPDGTTETVRPGSDIRFGAGAPFVAAHTTTLPSGLARVYTANQSLTLPTGANAADPFAYTTATWTSVLNGRSSSTVFTKATGRFTHTSPMGKKAYTDIDAQGRMTRFEVPNLTPVTYAYYPDGRLASVTQGARTQTFYYHASGAAKGWLASTTDALSRTTSFTQDSAGRLTGSTLPGPRALSFGYDAAGNLTSLTPPGKPAHTFGYMPNDVEDVYTPPMASNTGTLSTLKTYNLDEQPTLTSFPDGTSASFTYESGGRLATVTTPRHTVTAGYSPTTGHLVSLADSAAADASGASLAFNRDGPLVTSVAWAGGISGSVGYKYNTNFDVASVSVNGETPIAYTYDNDMLLSAAGSLTTTRNTSNGLLTGTTLGSVTTTQGYNLFGEVTSLGAKHGTATLYSVTLVRDNAGRITSRTETVQGVATQTWGYTYDAAGRLETVTLNGTVHASYGYDDNGNRTSHTEAGIAIAATYDAQDRLLTRGATNYTWGPRGDLQTKTVGTAATQYTYDTAGNLTAVSLPDGTQVTYVIDAANRRVGKRVNSTLTQGFLYDGQLRVVAELDGAGSVVSRFVYGTRGHSPDYMVKGGITYRFVSDHLGSPRLIVNTQDGTVVQALTYDAWGNVLTDSNPGFQPFGFAGGLYDRDTKLTRFGARDHDAETGRWTARDPIRFNGGDTNLYAYVRASPVTWIDPEGLRITSVDPRLRTAFNNIRSTELGRWLVDFLESSPDDVRIDVGGPLYDSRNKRIAGGTARRSTEQVCVNRKFEGPLPIFSSLDLDYTKAVSPLPEAVLFHELWHARQLAENPTVVRLSADLANAWEVEAQSTTMGFKEEVFDVP
ncbi:RHS repeat-associated core domain-containing protein [Pyxidicoccus caerfyrddinensis]|uniref:RHS repeat-associated core domain-containing protein n=1 Tax=Pyxidicoccus caerfyrddinensis TaxID=2709663 RepID=UPI0013DD816E|nr:RHS repeat-associated core domain-containing protein [Pyxidicoccus caerfyrddinensis]